jgi:thiol-disulfide isomerase/thioredoxin
MDEIRKAQARAKKAVGPLSMALWGLGLIGVAAVLYVISQAVTRPPAAADLQGLARGEMAKLQVVQDGPAAPATPILDAQGRAIHLADVEGPVTVVNLWATWCAPCVQEMPTLAHLQAAYPAAVRVVPVSMDRPEDRERARAFIAEHAPLAFYQDVKLALPFALSPAAEGFPTTVIYDRKGHERARLSGPADWDGPDARKVVEALLAEK